VVQIALGSRRYQCQQQLFSMPPRKRARTSAVEIAAPVPATISAVGAFQKDVAQCVELMYSLRHGTQASNKRSLASSAGTEDVTVDSTGVPNADDSGNFPFPLLQGGTFMEICQRAQSEPAWLLKESAEMCHAAGLAGSADPLDFQQEFVTAAAPHLKACSNQMRFLFTWFS